MLQNRVTISQINRVVLVLTDCDVFLRLTIQTDNGWDEINFPGNCPGNER